MYSKFHHSNIVVSDNGQMVGHGSVDIEGDGYNFGPYNA